MELKSQQVVNADVLVLGGGAGLSAAIEARKHGVGVLQVCEKVRKAVDDMVKDCQVTSGYFVQLGSQLLGSCSQVTIVRSVAYLTM